MVKKRPKGKGFKHEYDWGLYPETDKILNKEISLFLKNNKDAKNLSSKMEKITSTRFFDWIDHIVFPEDRFSDKKLKSLGFEITKIEAPKDTRVYMNYDSIYFPILTRPDKVMEVVLKPERLDHFLQMWKDAPLIHAEMFAPYRKSIVSKQGNFILSAAERNGYRGFVLKDTQDIKIYKEVLENFFCRKRYFSSDREGMQETLKMVQNACNKLSPARTADAFFKTERLYWERRNRSGQAQKARQDRLGLGWGNHDHHTYRSSRSNFTYLVDIFETMGYAPREQFYAGPKAGWGAQILENPDCNIVIFSDVDITENEKDTDFAHKGLENMKKLGTVGLWIALHGESVLQAGMHHLEGRFMFEKLRDDLKKVNINTMSPFSNFPFLKQAFVQGERWEVEESRLRKLLKAGSINKAQFDNFKRNGAIGSHMESLQRNQGFKGFNQDSVSAIIKKTDPRNQKSRKA